MRAISGGPVKIGVPFSAKMWYNSLCGEISPYLGR